MIEVEYYRRVAERTVGRVISRVHAPDDWYLKGGTTAGALRRTLRRATVTGTRRIGKLLLLDTDAATLGLRFGMTGRLLVDGAGPIERLEYSSARHEPTWTRFGLGFEGGGTSRWSTPGGWAAWCSTRASITSARMPSMSASGELGGGARRQPGTAQGVAARPEPRGRAGQPARRRDPLARRPRPERGRRRRSARTR